MLVIDDEAVVRDLMQRFLSKVGFHVVTAASGEEGLRLARERRPDAITLDVMMPGMDGWSVLSTLMADADLSGIPVIMLTIVDDKRMGYALGASEYLTKPIDRERVVAVLNKYRRDLPVLVVDDDPATCQILRRILIREAAGRGAEEAFRELVIQRRAEQVPVVAAVDVLKIRVGKLVEQRPDHPLVELMRYADDRALLEPVVDGRVREIIRGAVAGEDH